LSSEVFNIEGWDYDNVQTNLTLLLADQFGNPIADGTPVVFQTDSGAVGTSDRGGCTTVNGACTVPLRSQNPRFGTDASAPQGRAGLATVSVSASDNTNVPLTGRIAVFFSGSFATRITRTLNGSDVPVTSAGISLALQSCAAAQVQIRLNDARNNPMPAGTTLGATDPVNLAASFLPATVPSVGPSYTNGKVVGAQGSTHVIAITPDAATCVTNGSGRANGSTMVTITTPKGNVTTFPLNISYPAAP
jgi:hypothetical protein